MEINNVAFSVTSLKANQYIALLSEALGEEGITVRNINLSDILTRKVQVIHVHWPEHFLRSLFKLAHIRLLCGFLLKLYFATAFNIPVIWTVHNTWPHDSKAGSGALKLFFKIWSRMVDACIYMSPSTRAENEKLHPAIINKPYIIIPHGHYKDIISASIGRELGRESVGFNKDDIVLSHCGMIRSYKNTLKLIEFFSEIQGKNLRLIIAGKCGDKQLLEEIQRAVLRDSRIKFINRLLPEAEITAITAASDLVILPYTKVANSGVALYALSVGRPVLGPNQGAFRDLREQYGEWIQLYNGEFKSADLERAVGWAASSPVLPELDLSDLDWRNLAVKTKAFYIEQANRVKLGK